MIKKLTAVALTLIFSFFFNQIAVAIIFPFSSYDIETAHSGSNANSNEKADINSRMIRDELFKCKQLLNKNHATIHSNILRGINFQRADSRTIPPLALSNVRKINSASKTERELFLKHIVAAIKCVNKIIMEHRDLVILVKKQGIAHLSDAQKKKFHMICSFYRTSNIDELLKRVAPVPVSLAAAQAALESGFGSDKYIHGTNAYFGMMKNKTQLYSFDTVFEAAIAYAKTLNVNIYYKRFRNERFNLIKSSRKIDGIKLCAFIEKYCVKKEYRRKVISLIKEYNLTSFDQSYKYYS